MRKLLIFLGLATSLTLNGCSTINAGLDAIGDAANAVPSIFDGSSLVYQPTILQGNIVTQEQVNKLKPGMSRRQVSFILGTPTLRDTFHANRWDYHYTKGIGSEPDEIKHFAVHFAQDKLSHVSGDMQIQPEAEREPARRATVVQVPDWEEQDSDSFWPDFSGFFGWLMDLFDFF